MTNITPRPDAVHGSYREYEAKLIYEFSTKVALLRDEALGLVDRFIDAFEVPLHVGFITKPGRTWRPDGTRHFSSVWLPQRRPDGTDIGLQRIHVIQHLLGRKAVGVARERRTRLVVIDIDGHDVDADPARRYVEVVHALGDAPHVLVSSPRGLHLYFALEEWHHPAALHTAIVTALVERGVLVEPRYVEVYPDGWKRIRLPSGPKSHLLDGSPLLALPEPPNPVEVTQASVRYGSYDLAAPAEPLVLESQVLAVELTDALPLLLDRIERNRVPLARLLSTSPLRAGGASYRRRESESAQPGSTEAAASQERRTRPKAAQPEPTAAAQPPREAGLPSSRGQGGYERVRSARLAGCRYDRVSQTIFDEHLGGATEEEATAAVQALLDQEPDLPEREVRQQLKQARKWYRGLRESRPHTSALVSLGALVSRARKQSREWRVWARSQAPAITRTEMHERHEWLAGGVGRFDGLLVAFGIRPGARITIRFDAIAKVAGRYRGRDQAPEAVRMPGHRDVGRVLLDHLVLTGRVQRVGRYEVGAHATVFEVQAHAAYVPPSSEDAQDDQSADHAPAEPTTLPPSAVAERSGRSRDRRQDRVLASALRAKVDLTLGSPGAGGECDERP